MLCLKKYSLDDQSDSPISVRSHSLSSKIPRVLSKKTNSLSVFSLPKKYPVSVISGRTLLYVWISPKKSLPKEINSSVCSLCPLPKILSFFLLCSYIFMAAVISLRECIGVSLFRKWPHPSICGCLFFLESSAEAYKNPHRL